VVDAGRVRGLLQTLSAYRNRLSELASLPMDRYLADQAFTGRYLVQASAQVCIDIANHIISSEGWRTPRDFRDAFTVLEEHGVLEEGLAARIRDLAGLRNRLVHLYEEVDDVRVHAAIPDGLSDLEAFGRAAARLAE